MLLKWSGPLGPTPKMEQFSAAIDKQSRSRSNYRRRSSGQRQTRSVASCVRNGARAGEAVASVGAGDRSEVPAGAAQSERWTGRTADNVQDVVRFRLPWPCCGGRCGSATPAAGPMTAGLVGSERDRRHPHRRARSAPQCGVSRGPRASRVRVPISAGRRLPVTVVTACRCRSPNAIYSAASDTSAVASQILWNSSLSSGWYFSR